MTSEQLVKIYDGRVLIRSAGMEYGDTLTNFAVDSGEPFDESLPPVRLPDGYSILGRSYIPNEKHRITNGRKAIQLPMPWEYGERLLKRVAELKAAQDARR